MKKIKVLLPLIILFPLFFLFLRENKKHEIIDFSKNYHFEDPANYLFYQENDKIIIQNKKLDFSFKIPVSWSFEGFKDDFASGLNIISPDYKEDKNFILENGCKSTLTIYEENNEYQYMEDVVNYYKNNGITRDNAEIKEINGMFGYVTGTREDSHYKSIKIPLNNKIYSIEGLFSDKSKDFCEESYNNLLNSVSFLKDEE